MTKQIYYPFLNIGFVLLGFYYCFVRHDYEQAAITIGISLVFDPFDQTQKWGDRPTWQKSVLIIELLLMVTLFVIAFWPDATQGFRDGYNGK